LRTLATPIRSRPWRVGEQIKLLLLDAVLHLAALAEEPVIEPLAIAREIDHHIARVGATLVAFRGSMFLPGDDPAALAPAFGGMAQIGKKAFLIS
jgi:hypothetical protein